MPPSGLRLRRRRCRSLGQPLRFFVLISACRRRGHSEKACDCWIWFDRSDGSPQAGNRHGARPRPHPPSRWESRSGALRKRTVFRRLEPANLRQAKVEPPARLHRVRLEGLPPRAAHRVASCGGDFNHSPLEPTVTSERYPSI